MIQNQTLVLNLPILRTLKLGISLKIFWVLISAILLSLLVFSVLQLNTYTKERYLIQDYENKLNQFTQENKILEINFSQANSLNHLGNYVQNQIFEKAERIEYIRVLEGTVLAK